jgi:hypothetical protein
VYGQTVSGFHTWCEREILKGIFLNSLIKQVFATLRGYAKFVFSFRRSLRLKKWLGTTDSNALVLVSQEKKSFTKKYLTLHLLKISLACDDAGGEEAR